MEGWNRRDGLPDPQLWRSHNQHLAMKVPVQKVWCLPTMKKDSHLTVELYTLSAKSCQALPASGSLTPYLSQTCLDFKIEDQPASGIFKEPLQ